MKRETARNTIQKKNFHFLWTHSSCLPSLTPGSSCVTKRATKSQSHPRLSVMSHSWHQHQQRSLLDPSQSRR
jgi:hypothetical protein